ncbi:MAG: hypothetical protein EXS12_05590 [Phycisphaerales bacterium]|nr:hypothetical protein [Phycisphaerales bacterium]
MVHFSQALNMLLYKRCIRNRLVAALRIAVLAGFMFMCSPVQAQTMWCPADLNKDHQVSSPDISLLLLACDHPPCMSRGLRVLGLAIGEALWLGVETLFEINLIA